MYVRAGLGEAIEIQELADGILRSLLRRLAITRPYAHLALRSVKNDDTFVGVVFHDDSVVLCSICLLLHDFALLSDELIFKISSVSFPLSGARISSVGCHRTGCVSVCLGSNLGLHRNLQISRQTDRLGVLGELLLDDGEFNVDLDIIICLIDDSDKTIRFQVQLAECFRQLRIFVCVVENLTGFVVDTELFAVT